MGGERSGEEEGDGKGDEAGEWEGETLKPTAARAPAVGEERGEGSDEYSIDDTAVCSSNIGIGTSVRVDALDA